MGQGASERSDRAVGQWYRPERYDDDSFGRMNIRPSKAAQLAGVARSTIYKDIEDGKLSASLDGKGRKVIDVAELERVYGALTTPDDAEPSEDVSVGHERTDKKDISDNILQQEVAFLRERLLEKDERLREKDSAIEDLRGERDRLLTLLEEQTVSVKLLTDERVRKEPEPKRTWWRRS